MKIVLQRVSSASVTIEHKVVADIQKGVILVGIEDTDSQEDTLASRENHQNPCF
jgi:D-tyrosyl-tRNA(Tyr) deacylase